MIVPQNKMNVQGGFSGFTGTKVLASWYKRTRKVLRPDAFPEIRPCSGLRLGSQNGQWGPVVPFNSCPSARPPPLKKTFMDREFRGEQHVFERVPEDVRSGV